MIAATPTAEFYAGWCSKVRTDVDAKLSRRGRGEEAKLSYGGNLLMKNRLDCRQRGTPRSQRTSVMGLC